MRMKSTTGGGEGEMVQVEGGHIIRSNCRKDRHSKVYTSKGARDRRVRLAAHTAIQFYDVQDRLGYDRPSKALDWLINKAKNAIEELPPCNYIDNNNSNPDPNLMALAQPLGPPPPSSSFLGQSMVNAQSIDDTMKLFLPTSSTNFNSYPSSVQTEDLCLSLQSSFDHNSSHSSSTNQDIFSGSASVTLSGNFPRMLDWNGQSRVGFISELSQRETLHSNFSNLGRAWEDYPPPFPAGHQSPVLRSQYFPVGFSGLRVPARFHGEEE
ncbi:hypothetical protein LguiB_029662 [Lonicera macranthoides]